MMTLAPEFSLGGPPSEIVLPNVVLPAFLLLHVAPLMHVTWSGRCQHAEGGARTGPVRRWGRNRHVVGIAVVLAIDSDLGLGCTRRLRPSSMRSASDGDVSRAQSAFIFLQATAAHLREDKCVRGLTSA